MTPIRVLVLGAAGRDFHDFLVALRDDPTREVVAFTAAQIPGIDARRFPASLAGPRYPAGIPIVPEAALEQTVRELGVDEVVLSYSDLSHAEVMHLASRSLAVGAGFRLLSPRETMLRASRPVLAVTAVRTGAGKSQVSRALARACHEQSVRPIVVRHPMPYGDLAAQAVQRFDHLSDLDRHDVTIEEREEHEGHLEAGTTVVTGVDSHAVLGLAESAADVIVWDGGNNDLPFFVPDLWITVLDAQREGHELAYHPGETNFRAADVLLVNKADSAPPRAVEQLRTTIASYRPGARVIVARSHVSIDHPSLVRGKRVLVVEDGPTHTHGGARRGAGMLAAERWGAREIVDPRPFAVGSIRDWLARWPELGPVLPALGYSEAQREDLESTIARAHCDAVVIASSCDLRRVITIDPPCARVRYEVDEITHAALREVVRSTLDRVSLRVAS